MIRLRAHLGFTLLEIMVVVAIIGIMTVAVALNLGRSSNVSRNTDRQADLRNLQSAIETYKNEVGRYPEACNGADQWSGELGTDYECPGGSRDYIVGLAPDYISRLPVDPKFPSGRTDVGYVYRTNAEGSVYKIMAMNTVEEDAVLMQGNARAYAHPFKSCDMVPRVNQTTGVVDDVLITGNSYCSAVDFDNDSVWGEGEEAQCLATNSRYQTSYALWGGFAPLTGTLTFPFPNNTARAVVKPTVQVICQ